MLFADQVGHGAPRPYDFFHLRASACICGSMFFLLLSFPRSPRGSKFIFFFVRVICVIRGSHVFSFLRLHDQWIPACAGMTEGETGMTEEAGMTEDGVTLACVIVAACA